MDPMIEREPSEDDGGQRERRRLRVPERLAGWRWFAVVGLAGVLAGALLGLAGSAAVWWDHRDAREVPTLDDDDVQAVADDPPHQTAGTVHAHLNAVIWGGATLDDEAPVMLRSLTAHVDDPELSDDLRQAADAIEQRHLHAAHSLVVGLEERLP